MILFNFYDYFWIDSFACEGEKPANKEKLSFEASPIIQAFPTISTTHIHVLS